MCPNFCCSYARSFWLPLFGEQTSHRVIANFGNSGGPKLRPLLQGICKPRFQVRMIRILSPNLMSYSMHSNMPLTGLNGETKVSNLKLKKKILTIISHERYDRDICSIPHPLFLGTQPWHLIILRPGTNRGPSERLSNSTSCQMLHLYLCYSKAYDPMLSQCSLNSCPIFPIQNGCTLHRRALEMKQESQQSLEWNLQHVEEYLDIWFLYIFVLIASLSLDSDDLQTEQPLHKFHDPPCRRRSIAGSHGSSFWPCLEPKSEGSQVEKNLDPKKSPIKLILPLCYKLILISFPATLK